MRFVLPTTVTLLTTVAMATPAIAENIVHLQQLLSTKDCQNCQLHGAGLVHANLAGANLQGADLSRANLSQADLSNANLQGANLAGAVLQGANLNGANLSGADLRWTDFRNAYLFESDFTGTDLTNTYLRDAIGLPETAVGHEAFYRWGIEAGQQKSYQRAIGYFSQAIARQPDFAPAYLARAIARYKLFDAPGAISDSDTAAELFAAQGDPDSEATAKLFTQEIQAIEAAAAEEPSARGNLGGLLQGVGMLLMRFLL